MRPGDESLLRPHTLQLEPQAEFHPSGAYMIGKRAQARGKSGELLPSFPVSQRLADCAPCGSHVAIAAGRDTLVPTRIHKEDLLTHGGRIISEDSGQLLIKLCPDVKPGGIQNRSGQLPPPHGWSIMFADQSAKAVDAIVQWTSIASHQDSGT